jgi:phage terminase Nu1 subunit (DNA packaging protein)
MPSPAKGAIVGRKAIAAYMQVHERTITRWIRVGLPVYRHGLRMIWATRNELDKWEAPEHG